MSPIYQPKHAVAEGQLPGFTYGVFPRFVVFSELPGKHRKGRPFRYHGFSDALREFFDKLHRDDVRGREMQAQEERARRQASSVFDTITMSLVPPRVGKHHLRPANQWPTHPQTLLAEASQ